MKSSSQKAKLTPVQFEMFSPETWWVTDVAISSPVSVAGVSPCASLGGQKTAPSGLDRVPAKVLAAPESKKASTTRVISGPISSGSSASVALTQSLVNRLKARLGTGGSMEYNETYAVGHCVLGAHSVGAPHIRQRLFWVAQSDCNENNATEQGQCVPCAGLQSGGVAHSPSGGQRIDGSAPGTTGHADQCDTAGGVGDMQQPTLEGCIGPANVELQGGEGSQRPVAQTDFWSDAIWHQCRDGKARRISPEPEIFPLAHGSPGRVGLLRGAGNAIVPPLAQAFIEAYMSL